MYASDRNRLPLFLWRYESRYGIGKGIGQVCKRDDFPPHDVPDVGDMMHNIAKLPREGCNIYDADHRNRCGACRNVFGQMFTVHELMSGVSA